MYLIRGIKNIGTFRKNFPEVETIATIGNFDGLHLGHQTIIKTMQDIASKDNLSKLILFTEPHAQEFFAEAAGEEHHKPPRIFPWRQKVIKMKEMGVEFSFFLKFNSQLRSMTPDNFLNTILLKLNIRKLIIGDDFRFGANREGNFDLLKHWGKANNIDVLNTTTFKVDGHRVSSTRIREFLTAGDFKYASKLLGRPYTYSGKVVFGQQLGGSIGVPTANVWLPKNNLPISGVYIVQVKLNSKKINGIANLGIRPTVGGETPVLEVHLLDFNQKIYGETLEVEFIKKVREEQKFLNLQNLKDQIFKDISAAREYFI
jgi:riboflavin kinase/FMN adenylyltransferase